MSKNIFKVVISLGALLHIIGFVMGAFNPSLMAEEFGATYNESIHKMTIHLALFFFAVAVCYSVSAFWSFQSKREGFQLGVALGFSTVGCFILDLLLVGKDVDYMLLVMGLLLVLTGFFASKQLSQE